MAKKVKEVAAKAAKQVVKRVSYTRLEFKVLRTYNDYGVDRILSHPIKTLTSRARNSYNNEKPNWTEQDFNAFVHDGHLVVNVNDCEEYFAFPLPLIEEIAASVKEG